MPVNTELVARLLQPIGGDVASGKDLRYDPRVDALKESRREELDLPGVTNRKMADWPAVVASATKLLSEETKDLQLAAWLTEALLHKDGYAGLATGLEALGGMIGSFWETIYPLPEDDDTELRIGPLEWLGSKLAIPVRMTPFSATGVSYLQIQTSREVPSETDVETDGAKRTVRADGLAAGKPAPEAIASALDKINKVAVRVAIADLDAALTALAALEKASDDKFGRDAPAFGTLRGTIDEIKRYAGTVLAQKLETDPDPEIPEAGEGDDGFAGAGEDGTLSVEPTNRADASQRLAVVARWFRAQDSTNPAPYMLVRGFRWGELRANAPDVDPKLLEAPPTVTRSRLKALLIDGKWPELLEQCEMLMSTAAGRGWLDLQRYVLTACSNLGGGHDAVANVVRSELRALLEALPQLSRMTLMDDTPTANDETREWLANEELTRAAETPASADDAPLDVGADDSMTDGIDVLADSLEDDSAAAQQGGFTRERQIRRVAPVRARDPFDLARGELAIGRPNRAIQLLMAELQRDQSTRGRFVRQTQIAYVMVEAGLDTVALPILQRLVETIDERSLEHWESGPLVAQPMALLCRVYDRMEGYGSPRAELYLRVCRLDPLQALALQSR